MQIKKLPALFEPARPILQKIEQAGFEAYFVGGSVRDTILDDPIHDIDIATSAYPSEIKKIFRKTVDTGIQHGTVMILDHGTGYETTTFRTESGYQDYRRPDQVTFVRSLRDDLKRRDFTINALAMKEDGTVIDLFDGLGDLDRHLIRAVGNPEERFNEDALRMMRAVRFAAKLDFTIDSPTLEGIRNHGALLQKIAVERIEVEFTKLLQGLNPQRGLADLIETGLYQYCPGLTDYREALQAFSRQDQWQLITNDQLAWLSFINALGITSRDQVRQFMKSWKLSNELIDRVQKSLQLLLAIHTGQVTKQQLFAAGRGAVQDALTIADFNGWQHTDLLRTFDELPIKDSHELAINGGQLIKDGILKPGPMMGRVLKQLQQLVINGEVPNDRDQLLRATKKLIEKE
ncbi:CCA tRNA nucleotidyltransferase [Limosilactobacillus caecicola]|uniref:CCA tRNA nucleotidyltransferase n=1 Tax=Limosilactobacillus caecicola TaxID=2941332 RepID=UPI00203C8A55|nr:CCA tRNA nucleotidyltransferase [Limosilactobacillus caecicola]